MLVKSPRDVPGAESVLVEASTKFAENHSLVVASCLVDIEFRQGKKHGNADPLSGCQNLKECTRPNESNKPLKCGLCHQCQKRAADMESVMLAEYGTLREVGHRSTKMGSPAWWGHPMVVLFTGLWLATLAVKELIGKWWCPPVSSSSRFSTSKAVGQSVKSSALLSGKQETSWADIGDDGRTRPKEGYLALRSQVEKGVQGVKWALKLLSY